MRRIHKLLLHKIPLMYSMIKCSTPLLENSRAAVPYSGAAVSHPLPQQQLHQLLHHIFRGSILIPYLKKKKLKIKKKKKKVLSIQDYAKPFNGITPLTTSLEASEGE
jgi:hypothetical protein